MTKSGTPSVRAVALVTLLGAAMVTATYLQGALSVLSRFVIDEFGITRGQLGIAFTAFSLTGAVVSPMIGGLADKGARSVMVGLFAVGGAGLVLAAAAPSYGVLLAGAVLGGLALGAGNPVTNRVIAQRVSLPRRGLVVGLKQAGPPLGLLAAGVMLPPLAVAFGWRTALAVSALLPFAGLIVTPYFIPREGRTGASITNLGDQVETRSVVIWLTVIGLAAAMGLSAVIAFLPLYAQEEVGLSATTAGALAAFMGLAGVVGRIAWGHFGGRFARPSTALIIISGISVASVLAIAGAAQLGPALVWAGSLGIGVSMLAWHSVAWLVIIDRVGMAGVGKASGIMQLGNGVGFGAGPPAAGALIDATSSYNSSWLLVGALFVVTLILTLWIRIRTTRARARQAATSSGTTDAQA